MLSTMLCATVLCLSALSSAHAARLAAPYSVEVPVASQSQADRKAAESTGLLLVLERLSGRKLAEDATVKAALGKAENYLLQFSYRQAALPATFAANQPAVSAPAWNLQLVFVPELVNGVLETAGIPLWPLDRPQVLLLIANQQPVLLPAPAADGSDATQPLLRLGEQRGLPLKIPDPAEQDVTVMAAVQSLMAADLLEQLERMQADALLLGSVTGDDAAGWRGEWLLSIKGQEQRFAVRAASFLALVDDALLESATRIAGSYQQSAVSDSGPAQLRLQVDGVRSFTDFSRLRDFLEKLDAVQHMGSLRINGSTVIVDVDVTGRESFRNLVGLFKPLQWQEEIAPPPGSDPSLRSVWRYQWIN